MQVNGNGSSKPPANSSDVPRTENKQVRGFGYGNGRAEKDYLTECCYCISLRTGCIIISVLMMLHPISNLLYYFYLDQYDASFQVLFSITSAFSFLGGILFVAVWLPKRSRRALHLVFLACEIKLVLDTVGFICLAAVRVKVLLYCAIAQAIVSLFWNCYSAAVICSYVIQEDPDIKNVSQLEVSAL